MNTEINQENNFQVDLTNCDREPIHIPGLIQPHGVLIAVDENFTITQISANCGDYLGSSAEEILGKSLETLFKAEYFNYFKQEIASQNLASNPVYLNDFNGNSKTFEMSAHRFDGILIIECEVRQTDVSEAEKNLYSKLRSQLGVMNRSQTAAEFCQMAAKTVRSYTGFDRVMIYRFHEDDSGEVIAEDLSEAMNPFYGLHYPASDIPKQARALYLKQLLRFAVDVGAAASPIVPTLNPQTNSPLDLSFAVTRAMSPIHVEYLKNMGVAATMSISIVKNGKLWGLIACHHHSPRYISHQGRMIGELVAHTISLQIESKINDENFVYRSHLDDANNAIVEDLSKNPDIVQCLINGENNLLKTIEADGAALVYGDQIFLIGQTPTQFQVKKLVEWLWIKNREDVFATNKLLDYLPSAEEYSDQTSGILAIRLTQNLPEYLIWFRAEYAHSINWAGNPEKPVTVENDSLRLSPRKSFAAWSEEVRGKSKPWQDYELEFAQKLRRALVEIIINRIAELRELNQKLEISNVELDSFAYVASHDLKEPLRGINNYSNFLLEDYGDKLDTNGIEQLQTLIRLTERMEVLLDSLLHFSRVGRIDLQKSEVELNEVLQHSLLFMKSRIDENKVEIVVPQPLPKIFADEVRVSEIFSNLISNAIKYNDKENKQIEIGFAGKNIHNVAGESKTEHTFYVRDNGIGIDEKHQTEVFRIFKRLHSRKEYGGGVGAGLTIVKKIIERHGGRIWLESQKQEGTTFYFTLG